MSAEEVQKQPIGQEETGGGFLGAIKNTFGLGDSVSTPRQVAEKRIETVTTAVHTEEHATQSTKDEWRKAEAETVRAEEAAKKAEVLASKMDASKTEVREAEKLREEAGRKLEETQQRISESDSAAAEKEKEAEKLQQELDAARSAASEAEHRRAAILKEASLAKEPVKSLAAEADALEREAGQAHHNAMALQKKIDQLRSSRAIQEAKKKEEEAQMLRSRLGELQRDLTEEERLAQRKQEAADAAVAKATAKINEADELAKRYWAVRDESKKLEAEAKELARDAERAAKDAASKRSQTGKLGDKAGVAEREAEEALRRKAQLEQQAQQLAGSRDDAEEYAAQMEREAASRRAEADEKEREVEAKRKEAEGVRFPDVPESDLAKRAERMQKEAAALVGKRGELEEDAERLTQLREEAARAGQEKAASITTHHEEATALRKEQEEHWERAKKHGDAARQISSDETKRRMKETSAVAQQFTEGAGQKTEEGEGDVKSTSTQEGGEEDVKKMYEASQTGYSEPEPTATDLSKTTPSKPKGTRAGSVDLPVKESGEEYSRAAKATQESSVNE